jgi:hypothetical protein
MMKRSPNTMSDAIAMSSPNGRMSRRAQADAQTRLSAALFPPGWNALSDEEQVAADAKTMAEKKQGMLNYAAFLRGLADKGMKPRAYRREAERHAEHHVSVLPRARA